MSNTESPERGAWTVLTWVRKRIRIEYLTCSEDEAEAHAQRLAQNGSDCRWQVLRGHADVDISQPSERESIEARGLVAELLALNPTVSGDMEKARVFADVLGRLKRFAQIGMVRKIVAQNARAAIAKATGKERGA